ncbi:hypothetical protein C2869_17560 [Saccharobesus litoralis]|uniref:Succinylglutamate desuccinylase n=1 Tax=Saccharobesus litoralis TaxID=2172099 RepID=A0A2S0VV88_9ALTE|nr:succinylglutamate desuccinylase [Saccharobesus litoralis]AWB68115.1 hypothetical protein C2869_17560 [Saccharobesus litoralis]
MASCHFNLFDDLLTQCSREVLLYANPHWQFFRLTTGIYSIIPTSINYQLSAVIISCGLHGNETAPIELNQVWLQGILDGDWQPIRPILFIAGNPKAIFHHTRFIDYNLNRLFAIKRSTQQEKEAQGYETRRSQQIKQAVEHFVGLTHSVNKRLRLVHFDLHCSIRSSHYPFFAVLPVVLGEQSKWNIYRFLANASIQAVINMHKVVPTFSCYTAIKYHALSATIELGQAVPFGCNDLTKLESFSQKVIQFLTSTKIPLKTGTDFNQLQVFNVSEQLIKTHADLRFNFANDVKNFSQIAKGQLLGWQNGKPIQVSKNTYLVFPNPKVKIGQRALLLLETEYPDVEATKN